MLCRPGKLRRRVINKNGTYESGLLLFPWLKSPEANTGEVKGITETGFVPNEPVTREQLAAILYRYPQAKDLDVSVGEGTNILSYLLDITK